MEIELKNAGLRAESQQPIKVFYEGEIVGEFVADLVVEDTVIVERKSQRQVVKAHEIQLLNYLVAAQTDVGLILDLGDRNVEVKQKLKTLH